MNIDTVSLTEELVYSLCRANGDLAVMIPRVDVAAEIKMFPHPAPEDVIAPFVTHDIAGDERSAQPFGGIPGAFQIPWWVATWSDQINRQSLRQIVQGLHVALIGPEMRGQTGTFTSEDGTSWQFTIQREGAMAAPAGVDDAGKWHRVMERYVVTLDIAG